MTDEQKALWMKVAIVVVLIVFGFAARLLPHWPNMTPVTAILFAGASYLGLRWSLPLALGTMLISDLFIGLYDWQIMVAVYGSFLLIAALGAIFSRAEGIWHKGGILLGASTLFFIITNFAVWAFSPLYPHTFAGLAESYFLGLPFWRNMLLGDVVYTSALMGAFSLVRARSFAPRARSSALAHAQ